MAILQCHEFIEVASAQEDQEERVHREVTKIDRGGGIMKPTRWMVNRDLKPRTMITAMIKRGADSVSRSSSNRKEGGR